MLIAVFAALGRFVYRRRLLVVLAWLAVLGFGFGFGGQVFGRLDTGSGLRGDAESVLVSDMLARAAGGGAVITGLVDGREAADPAFRAELDAAVRDLRTTPGVRRVVESCRLPWSIVQLGARAEYRYTAPAPVTGGQSAAAEDQQLDDYLHLYLQNRGILLTPFHNMALLCPATSRADVDLHTEVFSAAVADLTSA